MERLRIGTHIFDYSIEVNNCIDYKFAAACSVYNDEFLELYCAYWSVYNNWKILKNNDNAIFYILENLGLKCHVENLNNGNLIERIKSSINKGRPVVFFVSPSTLFFSIVYRNSESNKLSHALLITGYDDEKRIIYFRENSINKDVFFNVFKTHPFLEYQMTFEMLEHIYQVNSTTFENYNNSCFFSIEKKQNKDIFDIKKKLIDLVLNSITNKQDILVSLIRNIISKNEYGDIFLKEQTRRNHLNSLNSIFRLINNFYEDRIDYEWKNIVKVYIESRKDIFNQITKFSFKKNKIMSNELEKYIETLEGNNLMLYNHLSKMSKNYFDKIREYSLLMKKGTKIYLCSDLTPDYVLLYSSEDLIKLETSTFDSYFFISKEKTKEYNIKIELENISLITCLIIEHSKYIESMIDNYTLLSSVDGKNWEKVLNVSDNENQITKHGFTKLFAKYLIIKIEKPNKNYNNLCVVKNIKLYGIDIKESR